MILGFIGLGTNGMPMARNLVENSNLDVIGFDPIIERMQEFEKCGGIMTVDVFELYNKCDIIFLYMPSNEIVEIVINDILKNGHENMIIVDLNSTSPAIIHKPVAGGKADKKIFDEVEPLLKCIFRQEI